MYFEFKEKIAEECGGNKEKYHQILDGIECNGIFQEIRNRTYG